MSIQKHLNSSSYIRLNQDPHTFQYRVRNLSKNQSMKNLPGTNPSKKQVLSKIKEKYTTMENSFISKQNINNLQVQSEQDLPKYSIQSKNHNEKFYPDKSIRRSSSHRILRKVVSCQLLPESVDSNNHFSLKDSFLKNDLRKVSLKKKIDFIKRKHNQASKSTQIDNFSIHVQSEQLLGERKKSKPKLKLLVRDPFHPSKANERKKTDLFLQSRIQPINDLSMMSETDRREFQEVLSCFDREKCLEK